MLRKVLLLAVLMLCSAASGCGMNSTASPTRMAPTPTISSLFSELPTATPPPRPIVADTVSPVTPRPTLAIEELTIYDDTLDTNWSAANSIWMRYDLASTAFVHSGRTAIEAAPTRGASSLMFTVEQQALRNYRRDQVLGVSFWLHGGSGKITTKDLAVTVLGSDTYPYWIATDPIFTGALPDKPVFSETRLYFLDVNRTIPPDTWVEITLILKERQFDPDYTYVTGVYIKNDMKFLQRFYIDNLRLLVVE